MDLQTIGLAINVLAALLLAVVALRNLRAPGVASLIALSAFTGIWSVCYWLYKIPEFNSYHIFLTATALLSVTLAASALLVFALAYTQRSSGNERPTILLLGIAPVLAQIAFWIPTLRVNLLILNDASGRVPSFTGVFGALTTIYIYSLLFVSAWLLFSDLLRRGRSFGFARSVPLLAGIVLPGLAWLLDWLGSGPSGQIHATLFAFTLADLGICYALFRRGPGGVEGISRREAVEEMDDGWIVLNANDVVVDINPAAERMTGWSRAKIHGQPITLVLDDLPNLSQVVNGSRELEMKRSVRSEEGWRYLNIRISSLSDRQKNHVGRLLVWHDITDRRLVEDARQKARDEMFVLLNAISSAASNTLNLDDFLLESIYHIIYPFRSQVVGIFLLDERKKGEQQRLYLASHFGLPAETVNGITHIYESTPLFEQVVKKRQTLSIEEPADDRRVPPPLQDVELSGLLEIPLVTQAGEESKVIGCICLGRKEKPVYSQDEIVRLTTISEHIATLIDSDRRRKLSIALSERQRLLRDLHDSVSQKLYGLVTLTEAAQAGLEAGSAVDPAQVLARIGENARQAVKEMRLFLFQMQPIDVEKDGLISVLHHRLAAVEGRADIKARLLADENISLSKEKETALYYIAQEALNNVLKHAHAKSISVTLKQGRQNVILEIVDDGYGFDVKKVDRGGLGLQNMRERVSQIGGKLKISSKPEEGTKIVITVRKDPMMKKAKRRR